jgi:hypothetical protein
LSNADLGLLEDLVGRHVNLSGGERAELEALCGRVMWR